MWPDAPLCKIISPGQTRRPLFSPSSLLTHIIIRRRSHTTHTQQNITKAFTSILRRETCRRLSLSCKSPLGGARSLCALQFGPAHREFQDSTKIKARSVPSGIASKPNQPEIISISDFAFFPRALALTHALFLLFADCRRRRIFDSASDSFWSSPRNHTYSTTSSDDDLLSDWYLYLPRLFIPNILPTSATPLRNISSF
jgi:hypothetical protein